MAAGPCCRGLVCLLAELRGRGLRVADGVAGSRRGRARRARRLLDDGGRQRGRAQGQGGGGDDAGEGLHVVLHVLSCCHTFDFLLPGVRSNWCGVWQRIRKRNKICPGPRWRKPGVFLLVESKSVTRSDGNERDRRVW